MWSRALLGTVLLAALGLAIGAFVSDAVRADRVPTEQAIADATARIRAGFRPGDAVFVEPTWYTLPWHALERMGPGTEAWPYPALLLSEDIDPLEALSFDRVWVLAAFARPADLPELVAPAATGRTDVEVAGDDVALAVHDLPRVARLRTLTADLAKLDVRRGGPGPMTPCRWRSDRHKCTGEPFLDVHLDDRIVYHRQVEWLLAYPSPPPQALEIAWKDLPGGDDRWLYVRAGWTMEAVRHPDGSPTILAILIDGREVDRVTLDPIRYWMERRAVRLPAPAAKKGLTVTFRVSAEGNIAYRELMLQADVLGSLPDVLRGWATAVVE